jgi:hypothetical protein
MKKQKNLFELVKIPVCTTKLCNYYMPDNVIGNSTHFTYKQTCENIISQMEKGVFCEHWKEYCQYFKEGCIIYETTPRILVPYSMLADNIFYTYTLSNMNINNRVLMTDTNYVMLSSDLTEFQYGDNNISLKP